MEEFRRFRLGFELLITSIYQVLRVHLFRKEEEEGKKKDCWIKHNLYIDFSSNLLPQCYKLKKLILSISYPQSLRGETYCIEIVRLATWPLSSLDLDTQCEQEE